MKKFLTICVGLLLSFVVTACSKPVEIVQEEAAGWMELYSGYSGEEMKANIQIYLDENNMITGIYCDDAIAEAIAKKADVKGKSIKEGYVALLDAGCTLGYYNADEMVAVNIIKEQECMHSELAEWTVGYVQESKNYFDFSMHRDETYTGKLVAISAESDEKYWIQTKVYENGVLKLEEGVADDGATSEIRWEAENVYSYSINKRPNGDFNETFYEEGQILKEISHQTDGSHMEKFYENGQIVRMTSMDDKNEIEILYENGKMKKLVQKGTDGSYYENIYDANEVYQETHEIKADGSKLDSIYYSNGNKKEENYVLADNSTQKHQYYKNGKTKYSYIKTADGTVREWEYNENGVNIYYYEKLADGSYSKQTFDADGNQIKSESENFVKTYVYQDGKLIKETYKDSQQSSESYYDLDGNVTKVVTSDRNGTITAIYAPNNILIESEYIRADGFCTKTKYNEKGVCIYSYTKEADGSVLIQYFDDNGNLVKQEMGM